MLYTIVQRACFWLQKVFLAPVKPMLSPDKPCYHIYISAVELVRKGQQLVQAISDRLNRWRDTG